MHQRNEDLQKKIAAEIREILEHYIHSGTLVEVYTSAGQALATHGDHDILNFATIDAAVSIGFNHNVTWYMYEDFPYVLAVVRKYDEKHRDLEWMRRYLRNALPWPRSLTSRLKLAPKVVEFGQDHFDRKMDAIYLHRSQVVCVFVCTCSCMYVCIVYPCMYVYPCMHVQFVSLQFICFLRS
jgi:hypothetical protein